MQRPDSSTTGADPISFSANAFAASLIVWFADMGITSRVITSETFNVRKRLMAASTSCLLVGASRIAG
jgi:hypothetical protein